MKKISKTFRITVLLCCFVMVIGCNNPNPPSNDVQGGVYMKREAKVTGIYMPPDASQDNSIALPVSGTRYYVSSSEGSDDNSGTSPDNPWRTLRKVSSFEFVPGDGVFLKCGDVWEGDFVDLRISGTLEKPIYFSSYGEGTRPWIRTSRRIKNEIFPEKYDRKLSVGIQITSASGWYIRDLIITDCQLGISLNNAYNKPMKGGLTIELCDIRDITSGDKWVPVAYGDNWDGYPYYACGISIWGAKSLPSGSKSHMSLENALEHLKITNCTIVDCDTGAHIRGISGSLLFKDCLIDNPHMEGVCLETHSYPTNAPGIIDNIRVLGASVQRGMWWGTTAMQFNICKNIICRNSEFAYTGNGHENMDMTGGDFEGLDENITLENCYIHDNGGSGWLIMTNPAWGFENGKPTDHVNLQILNCRIENNGLATGAAAFLRHDNNQRVNGKIIGNTILKATPEQPLNDIYNNELSAAAGISGLTEKFPLNYEVKDNTVGIYKKEERTLAKEEVAVWDFNEGYSVSSWHEWDGVVSFCITGQYLHGTLNGETTEACIQSPPKLGIDASVLKTFEVSLKNKTDAKTFKVYVKNTADDSFTEDKSFSFAINSNTKTVETYTVDISDIPFMQENIYQMRIMPCLEAKDGYFQIDQIRLLK